MANARQSILDAVITRLKTITVANGYNLEIGSKVYDWKLAPLKPSDLPAIEVRDGEAPIEISTMSGGMIHRLNITIIILTGGTTAAASARSGLADIVKALHTDRTFGGLVKMLIPVSSSIEMQQEENLLAAGQYVCTLAYYTNSGTL